MLRTPTISVNNHTSMPGLNTLSDSTISMAAAAVKFSRHQRYFVAGLRVGRPSPERVKGQERGEKPEESV